MFSPGQGCRRCRGWRGCRRWRGCRGSRNCRNCYKVTKMQLVDKMGHSRGAKDALYALYYALGALYLYEHLDTEE